MLFLYPLHVHPLSLIIFASFTIWVALSNIILFLLGIFLFVLSAFGLTNYLFEILQHTANGHMKPPTLNIWMLIPGGRLLPFKLLAVSGCLFSMSFWLMDKDMDYAAAGIIILSLTVLPAFIGIMGITNNLLLSMNPLGLIRFISRIGIVYLVMMGLLALGSFLIYKLYNSDSGLFIAVFITLYCLVLVFHLLGRVIHTKRIELDYFPEKTPERVAENIAHETLLKRKKCMDRVFRERLRGSVLPMILAYIESEEDRLAAHQWFHNELMQWDNKKLATQHGYHYVNALRDVGKTAIADDLTEEFISFDPTFSVNKG